MPTCLCHDGTRLRKFFANEQKSLTVDSSFLLALSDSKTFTKVEVHLSVSLGFGLGQVPTESVWTWGKYVH